jgi:hypothetical protein
VSKRNFLVEDDEFEQHPKLVKFKKKNREGFEPRKNEQRGKTLRRQANRNRFQDA